MSKITITPERVRRAMKDDGMPLLSREYAEIIWCLEQLAIKTLEIERLKEAIELACKRYEECHESDSILKKGMSLGIYTIFSKALNTRS